MKFCPNCQRVMVRSTATGVVEYRCTACSEKVLGDENDTLISTQILNAEETTEMYERLIEVSPFDPTNQLVAKDCLQCGLDYMTQIRVGTKEVIVYTCSCGAKITGGS